MVISWSTRQGLIAPAGGAVHRPRLTAPYYRQFCPGTHWKRKLVAPTGALNISPPISELAYGSEEDGFLKVYREYMEVRDYELDRYEVVNNSVYGSYLQHARRKYLEALSGSSDDAEEQSPIWALAELHMRYVGPLRAGDHFVVAIRVLKATPVRFILEEHIVRLPRRAGETEELSLVAEATVVALGEDYKPKRISPALLAAIRHGRPMPGKPGHHHRNGATA